MIMTVMSDANVYAVSDDVAIRQKENESGCYIFEFTMPARDVNISVKVEAGMVNSGFVGAGASYANSTTPMNGSDVFGYAGYDGYAEYRYGFACECFRYSKHR